VLRDPAFGPIRVRAFGTFSLKANDPKALLVELVGTDSRVEADEIGELMRSAICSCFADLVAASHISVVDLASNYGSLAEKLRAMIVERIGTEFGVDVPQFYIVNISLPEEVERALDARTSVNVIGDMMQYQQYQLGKAIPAAAANPAGGLAGAGVGVGMGMAIANRMPGAQPAAAPAPAAATAAAAAPAAPSVSWYVAEGGRPAGPLTRDQLVEAVASGRVSAATLVWCEGMAAWSAAGSVGSLASIFGTPPPPLPR
jgi:membrane protease subunit (stomatin/prohibitin family)